MHTREHVLRLFLSKRPTKLCTRVYLEKSTEMKEVESHYDNELFIYKNKNKKFVFFFGAMSIKVWKLFQRILFKKKKNENHK